MTKVTLIKRTEPRCPACQMMELQLDHAAIEHDVIDITDSPGTIEQYQLSSVPVTIIEKENGEEIRFNGFVAAETVEEYIT